MWCFRSCKYANYPGFISENINTYQYISSLPGADPGGAHPAPPLKLEKIWFCCVKSWFFTRNTRKIFAPRSARREYFKCPPLTWNHGSTPNYGEFKPFKQPFNINMRESMAISFSFKIGMPCMAFSEAEQE